MDSPLPDRFKTLMIKKNWQLNFEGDALMMGYIILLVIINYGLITRNKFVP